MTDYDGYIGEDTGGAQKWIHEVNKSEYTRAQVRIEKNTRVDTENKDKLKGYKKKLKRSSVEAHHYCNDRR